MKRIFQILLLLLPLFCYSQQRVVDSLERLLPSAATDSARFRLLYRIGLSYRYIDNYDSALFYYNKSLLLAQKNGKQLNEAEVLATKGFALQRLQRLPESFKVLTAALQIAEDPHNEKKFWNIPRQDVKNKDYRLQTLAIVHAVFGTLMFFADRPEQARFHLNEARKIWGAAGESFRMGVQIANLGHLYLEKFNQPDSALQLQQVAESIFVKKGAIDNLGVLYVNMGSSYEAKHDDSLALTYFYKALSINKKYDTQLGLAATYRRLTKLYLKQKNRDSSLYYAQQAAKIHLSAFPMDLGEDYENLSKSYELNHQQDSAYKYQGIALATYDSLYQNRIKGLAEFQQLSFNQQMQLQQLEAAKIAIQNKNRTYALLSGLGIVLLIGFFLYRNNQQQKKANMQIQKAYSELKAAQAQLIQSEKMASLGQLTAGIAHEIQNPLNFVNNFSEINTELMEELEEEVDNGNYEEVKAIVKDLKDNEQKIIHHGKRADSIVKGMLQHSRASSGKRELTDINALVDECVRLSFHGMRAKDKEFNVEVKIDLDESVGRVMVVPQDISRVLLNLLNNAFYAVDEKKRQLNGMYEPAVAIYTRKLDGKVEIQVKDNGNGIPQNIVDKVFQPFFTTKPTGQGTGLGLSLSYDIIKAHGGEIKVNTKEGEGSKFIIQLHGE